MVQPPQVKLTPELQALQQRWLALKSNNEREELYAKEFIVPFARLFAELPLYGAPEDLRPRALISVLGFSWQPVALMAAWSRPERLLVLGTEESLKRSVAGEPVISLIARVANLDHSVIESVSVGDPGEAEIYRAVRDFLEKGYAPREVLLDPTGGKKSMSAAAALAGFLAGMPLVYVDYTEYHGPSRIPVAGKEYPRLLTNPLEVFGDLERRDVFAAFRRSDFDEAKRRAKILADRLYEPREVETLGLLAEAYAAWDRFDFPTARKRLRDAQDKMQRFAAQGHWSWAEQIAPQVERNLHALETLASLPRTPSSLKEGLPLLVWYLAAADRLKADKPSVALLLIYAALERYFGLCLRAQFGLDDERPDYASLQDRLDRSRFDEAGRKMFGPQYRARELEGPLTFALSAQLLAALAPERLDFEELPGLHELCQARNKCEFEHGFLPEIPTRDKVDKFLSLARQIIQRGIESGSLEPLLSQYRFPEFPKPPRPIGAGQRPAEKSGGAGRP